VTVAVHVPQLGDSRGKHWAKVITGVDTNKASGWAFLGDFVADGGIQDLPADSVLLVYGERGSRGNPQPEAQLFRVHRDGALTLEAEATGRAWARTLRDRAADLTSTEQTFGLGSPFLDYSDEELARELRSRGWSVTPPR
jgi:hypothetical protein